ncbi:MAG: hypothetical protein ACYCVD_07625 [Desulfitobacteriaceae bacterium]
MTVVNLALSTGLGTSNYLGINALLSQFKTMITSDPNVTIITDTDPTAASSVTGRSITYKVGDFPHYFKIWAYSTTGGRFSTRNFADSAELNGVYNAYGFNFLTGVNFKLMYSSRTHLLVQSDANIMALVVKSNAGLWYGCNTGIAGGGSPGNFYSSPLPIGTLWYSRADDTMPYTSVMASYGNTHDTTGHVYLVPVRLIAGGYIFDYFPQITATTEGSMPTLVWYYDGSLNYYFRTPYLISE